MIVFQIAPMVDILLVVLVFFIVTWNFALYETELDIKVPTAKEGIETQRPAGDVVINIKSDGAVLVNKRKMNRDELLKMLQRLAGLAPDQAVILRGDENVSYKYIVDVLDVCHAANIWNVAFATGKPQ